MVKSGCEFIHPMCQSSQSVLYPLLCRARARLVQIFIAPAILLVKAIKKVSPNTWAIP